MPFILWKPSGSSWRLLARRVWRRCQKHRLLDHSASLSFYFMLALFPILVLAMSVAGSLIDSEPASRDALRTTLQQLLPRSALALVESTLDEIELGSGGFSVWAAALVAAWSATRGTRALVARLNVAYGSVGTRSRLRRTALSLVLTLGMLIVLVGTSVLLAYGDHVGDRLRSHPTAGPWVSTAWWVVSRSVLLGVALLVFELLYAHAPNIAGRRRTLLSLGAIVGVAVWVSASAGFRLWLQHFRGYTLAYGSVGAVIVLQLWLYLSATALLLGAEVNAEIEVPIQDPMPLS